MDFKEVSILKDYGDFYRLVHCYCVPERDKNSHYVKKCSVRDHKLLCNISRAKRTIFDLSICNVWEYFVTFTFSEENVDRFQLSEVKQVFSSLIRKLNYKYKTKLRYIVIPEKHKDGAWHFHALFSAVPEDMLICYKADEILPIYILDNLNSGIDIFHCLEFDEALGFNTWSVVRDTNAVSFYILKYLTKDLANSVSEIGNHLYFRSRNLSVPKIVHKGRLKLPDNIDIDFDFQNQNCCIINFSKEQFSEKDLLLNLFCYGEDIDFLGVDRIIENIHRHS